MCIPLATEKGEARPLQQAGISEAVLAAVWNEQSPLRGPMWDCEGNPVAVVYRGRWTAGSGPDFKGAILSLRGGGSALTTGSVEMHLRCADWYTHGHHADPRYNSVALHVVFSPHGARPVTRADGQSVPTLVLGGYISVPVQQLLDSVTPLLPRLGTLSDEPCWQRTLDWPLESLLERIDAAGDTRILSKAALMEAEIEAHGSADEAFYRGIMDSLGYSANRAPMLAIASAIPLSQLLLLPLTPDEEERAALLESVLLGAGGLLPSQRPALTHSDYLTEQYAAQVEAIWNTHALPLGLPLGGVAGGWTIDRVRPANAPPRRLAAAARLLARLLWQPGGMLGPFLDSLLVSAGRTPQAASRALSALLNVEAEGYWAEHSDFGRPLTGGNGTRRAQGARGENRAALVGASRAADMVVNVVIPLLVACAEREGTPGLQRAALQAYAAFPRLSENRVTRAMADEALGPRKEGAINSARRQQGLIHLYRLYCEARRCYECPVSGLAPRS